MLKKLPYPGYSWSFTQHAVGLEPKTLYEFLVCAAQFEGDVDDYNKKITQLMIASGVLTVNERDGVPDAWRDYQQILAELGLIYSTKICRALTITEMGHMFLAGEIGFSELIGMQALRYQYPNGQKTTIQSRLRKELGDSGVSIPDSLIELQVNNGILVKPAVLILRVLVGLHNKGYSPYLSTDECQSFVLPCKRNSDWVDALSLIMKSRNGGDPDRRINVHSRRNIQDWYKFLKKSDYFSGVEPNLISLSDYSLGNILLLDSICSDQEEIESFWIPIDFTNKTKLTWFDCFGSMTNNVQDMVKESLDDDSYIAKNYIAGVDDEIEFKSDSTISLKPVDLDILSRNTKPKISDNLNDLINNIRMGIQKRHSKALLHDNIVRDLAEKFVSQGAVVESSPDSIDLLSTWPTGHSAIFEIKTVTKRSMQTRLRLAIGQVEEYEYRRRMSFNKEADRVIVLNRKLDASTWQNKFLTQHLKIGLICKTPADYFGYSPDAAATKKYWES